MRFRKINLEALIDTLTHIYNTGADYVDIIGTLDDVQDVINIVVQEDYMTDNDDLEEDEEEENYTDKLSDEDINNLLYE